MHITKEKESHQYNRRSVRLKGYDYGADGLYFVTLCCQHRHCFFGKIENGEMVFNECGYIAHKEWLKLPERFPGIELGSFQIMPNHMHGIIKLTGATHADLKCDPIQCNADNKFDDITTNVNPNIRATANMRATARVAPTLPCVIGAYKSLVSNVCLNIYKSKNDIMGKLWQRNYYEHIIRNEYSFQIISEYIITNPARWKCNDSLTKTQ